MYEELVKRLRADSFVCNSCIEKRRCKNEDHICVLKNQLQAAKAIEKLEAKNKELENKMHDSFTEHLLNQISRKEKQIDKLKVEKSKLEKELELVKAEKEAALRDFKKIAQEGLCTVCEHYNCDLSDTICADCKGTPYIITDNFQWRGVQGGKDD